MQRCEAAWLDEIDNHLFESDDDDSEHNSDEDSGDGPNDDDKKYIAAWKEVLVSTIRMSRGHFFR